MVRRAPARHRAPTARLTMLQTHPTLPPTSSLNPLADTGHWHTAYSPDGTHGWDVERFSQAFNGTIPLQGGGAVQLTRRERSQVVFDSATGAPAFLFNGGMAASPPDGDHSFTTVQPVAIPPLQRRGA